MDGQGAGIIHRATVAVDEVRPHSSLGGRTRDEAYRKGVEVS